MKIKVFTYFAFVLMASCGNNGNTVFLNSGYAELNETKLYYELAGQGDPIVFIHGSFGDNRHWDFQFTDLAEKFMVLRYDVRGFGKSDVPHPDESYSDLKDLKSLLEFHNINKAHFCGLSRGSAVVVSFALEYPEMCLSLIPIGPWAGGYGFGDYTSIHADSLDAAFPKAIELANTDGPRATTDYLWKGDNALARSVKKQRTLDSLLEMGYDYSYWDFLNSSKKESLNPPAMSRLHEIKCPTLIITADYDLESCKEIATIMENEIRGSVKITIKDAGHIMNMDQSEVFNTTITEFIQNLN